MGRRVEARKLWLVAAGVAFAAGCAVGPTAGQLAHTPTFVYQPAPPAAGSLGVPVKVAVLPFKDGTEDAGTRGTAPGGRINLVRVGIPGISTAMPPDFWAKSFADDLGASGVFRSVRHLSGPSEVADEDFCIEGTVTKVYGAAAADQMNEIELDFRAARRAGDPPIWKKRVARQWKTPPDLLKGCGVDVVCMAARCHKGTNALMQEMFAEARADFVARARSGSDAGGEPDDLRAILSDAGEPGGPASPATPGGASAEETIDRILKGQ